MTVIPPTQRHVTLVGSRLDDGWQRLMAHPRARFAWTWGAPALVMLVAILTRLVGLGHPHELVFDETYYVKDAYTLSHLGYEGSWPADANLAFNAGHPEIYLDAPSFVAHPPIGKWIIALGLAVFGAADPFGWRIAVALCGILLVLVTLLLAKRLFRSTLLAVIAGGLLAIDGNAIVMSRVALLDTMLALFALLGAAAVLLDHDGNRRRLDDWMSWQDRSTARFAWGPVFWARPWLVLAGVCFGIASGIKWSGLYFLAVFAVYALVSEIIARHRAGVPFWFGGTVLRQGPVTFLLTVPVALAVYVASWAGWFATGSNGTPGGYYRHWIENDGGQAWSGLLSWVPYDFQNWWHYQAAMYGYHVNEHTPHSYQANPLTWLFLVRPTSMYWHPNGNDAETILGVANPLIWWAATAAVFFLAFRMVRALVRWVRVVPIPPAGEHRSTLARDAFILIGFGAGYLPWLLYLGRTVFQFYTIAFEPFMVLALTAAIATLIGTPADASSRRVAGFRAVGVFLVVCVLLSAFFLPIWTGAEIPRWFVTMHFWFPSWV
ncbi:MAG: phospholipid carrier-dependent glycosyltransferase [Schumannella sp.]|nr:phospholipid carrier-dependent glycosyltransferase [Schumannella sp.]